MTTLPPLTQDIALSELTATERCVAALWKEVLRTDTSPGSADNFFDSGGDSMDLVTLEFRISEEFGVQLTPGSLLSAPTLRELSTVVEAHLRQTPD